MAILLMSPRSPSRTLAARSGESGTATPAVTFPRPAGVVMPQGMLQRVRQRQVADLFTWDYVEIV
jgi:hypothetical protein